MAPLWEHLGWKVPPLLGVPHFYKAPPRHFQPPKCKLTPSKMYIGGGQFLCNSIQKLQIGGHQFTFWRVSITLWGPIYIFEAEIVLRMLYRKGGIPKEEVTLGSRNRWPQPPIFTKVLRYKLEVYCDRNGRRTGVQLGGVLRHKWEESFPFLTAEGHRKYCNTKLRFIGRLIFIHPVLGGAAFLTMQRQRCIKILCPTLNFMHRWRWIVKKRSTSRHWRCIKISPPFVAILIGGVLQYNLEVYFNTSY